MWFQIITLAYLHSRPVVLSPFKHPNPYVETLDEKKFFFLPCVGLKLLNYCYPIMCTLIAVFLYFLVFHLRDNNDNICIFFL